MNLINCFSDPKIHTLCWKLQTAWECTNLDYHLAVAVTYFHHSSLLLFFLWQWQFHFHNHLRNSVPWYGLEQGKPERACYCMTSLRKRRLYCVQLTMGPLKRVLANDLWPDVLPQLLQSICWLETSATYHAAETTRRFSFIFLNFHICSPVASYQKIERNVCSDGRG